MEILIQTINYKKMTEQLLELIDNCNLHERVQRRLELNLCVSKEDIQEQQKYIIELEEEIEELRFIINTQNDLFKTLKSSINDYVTVSDELNKKIK